MYNPPLNMRNVFVLIILCLISAPYAKATVVLSWDDCIRRAKDQNLDLKISEHELQVAKFGESQALSDFIPHITLNSSLTEGQVPEVNRSRATSLSITETLFSGFSGISNYDQAKLAKRGSEIDLKQVKAQLSFDLRNAISQVLFSREMLRLNESFVVKRKQNLKTVGLLFDSGRENKATYLLVQSLYQKAVYASDLSLDNLKVSLKNLGTILGIPLEEEIVLDPKISFDSIVSLPNRDKFLKLFEAIQNKSQIPKEVLAENSDLQKANLEEELAKSRVTGARSNFYPTVSLTQEYNRSYDYSNPEAEGASLTLSLSWALFNGGSDYYTLKIFNERLVSSALMKEKVGQSIETGLGDALLLLKRNLERLKVERDGLEAYRLNERVSNQQYFNSFLSFRDWNWAFSDLVDQETAYYQGQVDVVMAQAKVELLTGYNIFDEN